MRQIKVRKHQRKYPSGKISDVKGHFRNINRRNSFKQIHLFSHSTFNSIMDEIQNTERAYPQTGHQKIYMLYLDLYRDYNGLSFEQKTTLNFRMGEFLNENPQYINKTDNRIKEYIVGTADFYKNIFDMEEKKTIAEISAEKAVEKIIKKQKISIPEEKKEQLKKEVKEEIKKEVIVAPKDVAPKEKEKAIHYYEPGSVEMIDKPMKKRYGSDLI